MTQQPGTLPRSRFPGPRYGGLAALLGVATLMAVVVWLMLPAQPGPRAQQPIQFGHASHVKLMTCEFCHRFYETRTVAGRPELFRCMMCHAYPVTDRPEAAKLGRLAGEGREIPWVRLTRLPAHVRFSHQRHVVVGRVACQVCHGDIAGTTVPPPAPLVTIRMQFCLDCHGATAAVLPPASLQSPAFRELGAELRQTLNMLENRRFASGGELLAALPRLTGTPLTDEQRNVILGGVQLAPPVTTDCIACHR